MSLFQKSVEKKYLNDLDSELIDKKYADFQNYFGDSEIQENIRNSKEEQFQEGFLRELFVSILEYTLNPHPYFNLTKEQFSLMWLCLAKDNLLSDLPSKIKESSVLQEENITKKLYADYSKFREAIYNNLVKNNSETDKLLLFKKTQKLLDRFLFIFFAEDRLLVPPNSISQIIEKWKDDVDFGDAKPLYNTFKKYFHVLNVGRPKSGNRQEIYAYNGGLFQPDEILDNITIDDDILHEHTLRLSNYDFETDVDVNILGHIFEHSLGEIENVQAEIKGEKVDSQKTKRKKDGIFYTPKYITKYIVENTVGKLCKEKRTELGIVDEEYAKGRKNRKKEIVRLFDKKLEDYRNWLLTLTILDPACGSGAFLNQALEFLITEHRKIDELRGQLLGGAIIFSDITTDILEKNIYGVDLNEESVEIAKLSLWLRTAQKGRKLNTLSNNIKCGNSLIDNPEIAGEKAFNWQNEFPEIFENGGFDVVIGNPPYVRKQGLMENYPEMCEYYEQKYKSATANYDIYALFMERSFDLIQEKGTISFILPHKFLVTDFGVGIRQFFKENHAVQSILHFGSEMVFADASTYTCIINLDKTEKDKVFFKKMNPLEINNPFDWDYVLYQNLSVNNWDLQSQRIFDLIDKLKHQPYTVNDVFDRIFQGIASGGDKLFTLELIDNKGTTGLFFSEILAETVEIEFGILKPFVKGNQISKYQNIENTLFTIFPYKLKGNRAVPLKFNQIETEFPLVAKYYRRNEDFLRRRERGRFDNEDEWFLFSRKQGITGVEAPKIMTQEISLGCNMTYDENGEFYHPTTIYSFVRNQDFNADDKFYLGLFNSKIMWFFLKNTGTELRGGYFRFKTNYLKPFPLPEIPENPNVIIDKVNSILSLNKDLQDISAKFKRTLQREFYLETLSKKLENWFELNYADFLKELKKQKIELSLSQKAEWEDYFFVEQQKAISLKFEIEKTDKEIDRMVYELYGLTEEEIKIVEGIS